MDVQVCGWRPGLCRNARLVPIQIVKCQSQSQGREGIFKVILRTKLRFATHSIFPAFNIHLSRFVASAAARRGMEWRNKTTNFVWQRDTFCWQRNTLDWQRNTLWFAEKYTGSTQSDLIILSIWSERLIYLLLMMQFSSNTQQQCKQCCNGLPSKREESHCCEYYIFIANNFEASLAANIFVSFLNKGHI